MPTISVIIPSYNHDKYISEAIQSVLDQTCQDFEIVITDDGSSDNSVELIEEFTDPRIKLFVFSENKGACLAVNNCIENSTGKFIALLNSDDVFLPNKLEVQLDFLNSHPEIGAVFSYAKIINDESKEFQGEHFYKNVFIQPNRNRFEWLNYFFYNGNCLCHPSILIRRDCYKNVGFYDPRFAQLPDFDFWIRLCQRYEIYIIPEELICFRIRNNEINASGVRKDSIIRSIIEANQVLKSYLNIDTLNDFTKIFPNIEIKDIPLEDKSLVVKYYLANLALQLTSAPHRNFGLDIFYELMADTTSIKVLEQEYSFSFKDLIQLSGEIDFYRELEIQDLLKKSHDLQVIISNFQAEGILKLLWKLRIKLIKLVYNLDRKL
jgi:glycosyltransferase involved in cell wall biosynthesis